MPADASGAQFDADALIDYAKGAKAIIPLFVRHCGPVFVSLQILNEVTELDASECVRLGLQVFEPSLAEVIEARLPRKSLSEADRICLVTGKARNWVVITNDSKLRSACQADGVETVRGLVPIETLVMKGALSPKDAERVALAIHDVNKAYITLKVIEGFRKKIGL